MVDIAFWAYLVIEVGPVEAAQVNVRLVHAHGLDNIRLNFWRCGRREGDDGLAPKGINALFDRAVIWAEVVSPLGNTMRLINCKKTDGDLLQQFDVAVFVERFWGDVEQLGLACDKVFVYLVQFFFCQ